MLRFAEEESLKEEAKWERGDIFVTMAKCGAGFIVDDRCIMPNVIDMNCTNIVENIAVDIGDHLLIKDEKTGRLSSVLVYNFYHQTRIEVIPSLTHQSFEREIIDLTKYKEKYRVNYSHSLPSVEVNVRAESKVGQDLLKQCSDNSYRFVSWAKTGKEMELTAEQLLRNPKRLCVIRPNSYIKILSPGEIRIGDHLFWDKDKVKSYRKHVMVTECGVDGDPRKFMMIYYSKTRFKEKVKIFGKSMGEDTYRVNYSEALQVDLTLKRARHHLGGHNFSPLARLWFVRWAKTGSDEGIEVSFLKNNTRPVTKSRISCFTQLNPGDYIVAEPKMNFYHHYIVLSVDSPTQCVVVESWRKNIQRRVLNFEKISNPNEHPWYFRVNYEKSVCISPKDSIEQAMNLINTWHLNPMSRCVREGFVHYLKTGEAAEIDTDELLNDRILLQRERVTSAMELKCGDHIERPLALAPSHAQHHMLVVDPIDDEHCEVIHFKVHRNISKVLKFKKGDVVCEIVNIFEQGRVSRIRYPERINPPEGMKTLTELSRDGGKHALKEITGKVKKLWHVGWGTLNRVAITSHLYSFLQEEYNLTENNCEHLITIATIGFPLSIQVEKFILQALQCSKGVVRSCRGAFVIHASNCCHRSAPMHVACQTPALTQVGCCNPMSQTLIEGGMAATEAGAKAAAKTAMKVTTKAATETTTKSATKASAKTTSKAVFEVGSEAAINGTILGAIGGIAFGVNVLIEAPFYIRGAYKLHRKKQFDMISKEEYQREMIKITLKSVNTVVGGTLGAVAGQAAIPVPVLGAVVGGFVGGVAGQVCGYLEGKAVGCVIQDPTKVTLPILNTPAYLKIEELENQLKKSKSLCPYTSEEEDPKQAKWHV